MSYRVLLLSAAREAVGRYVEYIAVDQQMTFPRFMYQAL